jgi:Putative Ig domain
MTIGIGPLSVVTSTLVGGTVGHSYSATLAAVGGNPPYVWKLITRSLPRGLKLNKATGAITGTLGKRSVTSSFTVEVLDTKVGRPKTQRVASASFTITIS